MSSSFADMVAPPPAVPDPTRHVKYTQGMVLGVADFDQEFAYHAAHLRWITRDLIGYGTVRGLRVSIAGDKTVPEVVVAEGVAVSPRGYLIRVPQAQCARLNDWLAVNQAGILAQPGSPLGSPLGNPTVTLYVVLSYRECALDPVPIPGEPCRSEDDTKAMSRLADDFALELTFVAPDQHEEDEMSRFDAALGQVQITDAPGTFATLAQFLAAVRALGPPLSSPLGSPLSSPLSSPLAGLRIHTADAPAFLRAALRVWVTELRPPPTATAPGTGTQPPEKRLLLAELDVPLQSPAPGGTWTVADPAGIMINEERRPFLVPLRLLQGMAEVLGWRV
jgi:hypothetical protein